MYWILLLGLALALILQTVLVHMLWRRGLSVSLRFGDRFVYEGDNSTLQETIINDKWLPLPALEVRISMDKNLVFTGDAAENCGITDRTYKRDIFSLLFHQKITRTLTFSAKKRGCYRLKEADVKTCDFFYRPLPYENFSQDTTIYVYPAQVDTRRLSIITTAISGSQLVQNHLFPDPFEFSGIREYQPTDPMNRINWKATMRTGTTLVNQFDSTTNLDLTLLFDVEDSRILKEDVLIEETIRLVSSLSARLVAARMPITLYGNAHITDGKKELFRLQLPASAARMDELNQKLACIDGSVMAFAEMLSGLKLPKQSRQMNVVISKNTTDAVIREIEALASPTAPVLWVVPKLSCAKQPAIHVPYVQIFFWEVMQ